MADRIANIPIAPDDLRAVDEYRLQTNTSVLVVMFTDMKGSTNLAEREGEQTYNRLRLKHNDLLLEIIQRGGAGRYIKSIGDAIMAVFAKPSDAIERALEIQRTLSEYNESVPGADAISVRIGMHMGQVAVEDGPSLDVFGRHVNRAARVEAIAKGGHVLLTQSVYDSAKGWLDHKKIVFTDYGSFLLKGIPEPIDVWEVSEKGITSPQPPSYPSLRDRIDRMPLSNLAVLFVTWLFFSALHILVTPVVWQTLKGNPDIDQRYAGGFWSALFMSMAGFTDDAYIYVLLAVAVVLVVIQMRFTGVLRTYMRSRALTIVNIALVAWTAVLYLSTTIVLTIIAEEYGALARRLFNR